MVQINPNNRVDQGNLRRAIQWSYKKQKPFRTKRMGRIREYVGFNYSDDGSADKMPINLMELSISIYLQQLAAQAPRCLITTPQDTIKPVASKFEARLNAHLVDIKFGDTLELWVLEALFAVGILKSGLNRSGMVEIGGFEHDVMEPFAEITLLENWVCDMTVTRWEEIQYCGDKFRVPFIWTQETDMFPKAAREKIHGANLKKEKADEDSGSLSGQGGGLQVEEFKDTVELWNMWLPHEKLVLCFGVDADADDEPGELLSVFEWNGQEGGPYNLLGFHPVPGNIMPLAPASLWQDFNNLANELARKLGRQASRQKTITLVQAGADKDGNRVMKANDGEMIGVDNPKNVNEVTYGGINQSNLAFMIHLKDLSNYLAGNIESIGGLSPQSETLGQDRMLNASASQRLVKMQQRTINKTTEVIKAQGYYLWDDPIGEYPINHQIQGTDIIIARTFTPQDRQTPFEAFNLSIHPYSMQHQTPQDRLNGILGIIEKLAVPLLPLLQAQGASLDLEALFRLIAKYGDWPELNEIITYMDPQHAPPQGGAHQSPNTTRTNVRVNRPGATQQGKDQVMMQTLLGKLTQPSEMASLNRATG